MTLSIAGLIGAAIGLLIALGTYLTVIPLLERNAGNAGTVSGSGEAKPNVALLRTILQADFLVLAAVGYYVGQLFD